MSPVSKVSRAKALELWEVLCRAHGAMRAAIEKDMTPDAGMPTAWYEVLRYLTRAPQGLMRYQDLAKVAGLSDSGASRRLEQMVNAGLIDRQSCPSDRRGVYAHITTAGQSAFDKAHAVFLSSLERNLASHLEPDDAEAMGAALARLS
jgi:DNA-binding MarR family transcriptional regulator